MRITQSVESLFPAGYTPLDGQLELLVQIKDAINKGEKYIVVQAPTGSGKSFISKSFANACNNIDPNFERMVLNYEAYNASNVEQVLATKPHGAFALTTTKQLQTQYVKQFTDSSSLKGQRNYQCAVDDEFTVDMAPCTIAAKMKKECWALNKCHYFNSRNNTLISKFGVLNYSMFFRLAGHLKRRNLIICDEASELENEFVGNFSCKITYKKLQMLGIDHPKLIDDDHHKCNIWLQDLHELLGAKVEQNMKTNKFQIKKWDTARQLVLTELYHSIKNVLETWSAVHYVVERDGDTAEFVPFKVAPLTGGLFNYADAYILMSATIVNHRNYAKTLGIKDYKYIEGPSKFDPKKSPIFCNTKYPLSYANMKENLPRVIDQVIQIAKAHENEKGIIHTHSFDITQSVQRRLNGKRFLYREEGATNEDILSEHIMRPDPTVLISPSLTMGVDLKGDLGKWQIIIKLPYPSLGSKRVKMLFDEDKEWYTAQMLKVMVQAAGRCTRSSTDEAITYILDGNVVRILKDNQSILPKHFLERVV